MNRKKQLEELVETLENLVLILRLDQDCQWTDHFRNCLERAKRLRDSGFQQKELNLLSASVMSVYGGMGSFNDYAPVLYSEEDGKASTIQGMEHLSDGSSLVYTRALALRVMEST